jgi:hypothetical protein
MSMFEWNRRSVCAAAVASLVTMSVAATAATFNATAEDDTTRAQLGRTEKVVDGVTYLVHRVKADEPKTSSGLDPRVETHMTHKILPDTGPYAFKAKFAIDKAKFTTIAQILDFKQGASDTRRPQLFLTASKLSDGRVDLWDGNPENNNATYLGRFPSSFNVRITTDGLSAKLFINNNLERSVTFERRPTHSFIRFGAYHHGAGLNQEASIRVAKGFSLTT